jgi:hypothetical protein
MLDSFSYSTFADRIGETFRLQIDAARSVDIVLTTATDLADNDWGYPATDDRRTPFSVVFVGPSDVVLPQHNYRLESDTLGSFDLFIVPIGRGAGGVRYEAVFT